MSEYLRDRRIRVRIGNTLSDEFSPEEGVPTGGVDDLAICFSGRSLDTIVTIERHLQQAVNAIQEWATRNEFRFATHKCKVVHFTAPRYKAQIPPTIRISDTLLPVEESTKFLGLWWDSHLSFKEHISALKTQGGSQSQPSGCTLEVGRGQRHPADAVLDHCSSKARLWMYCVWHSIQYQFTTT